MHFANEVLKFRTVESTLDSSYKIADINKQDCKTYSNFIPDKCIAKCIEQLKYLKVPTD